LKGTWNSSFIHEATDDWHYVIDRLQQGKFAPEAVVTHRFDLDEILKGFEIMRDKREEYGKILMC
jgi:L-iditol 2-dehydrogenase